MSRKMLVDAVHPEETRVVITDQKSSIIEYDFTTAAKPQIKGNVYLAKITRVEPSLQAAFVEYGGGKQGFLPFAEIHPNYYQIPTADREILIAEEAAEAAADVEEDTEEESSETIAAKAEGDDEESVASEEVADEDEEENTDEDSNEDDSSEDEEGGGRKRRRRGGRYRRGGRRRGRRKQNDEENSDVETVSGDDDTARPRRKRDYQNRYKIQEVVKRNQVLLVQVIKEERGNKGVSLTSFLSLAGRYCVLMPNSSQGGGVSRKISSGEDRKRLKKVLAELALPQGMGVIIRTAGAGHTRAEIRRDYDYLVKLWNQIREDTLKAEAPALVYEENNIIQRCIRDNYNKDIDQILVDGEQAFKETKSFMRKLIPSHAPKVKHYKGDTPLFHKESIEEQLLQMTEPEVQLPSGGSIVMMPTEALISIDVNSGRSTRERNVEETALKTNIEAAKVVAHQLRLRDLAGLIVIDFIDMMEGKNRRAVERALKDALKQDRAKIQVGRISSFGLMEMSRQRMRPSISESINRICPHCKGTGFIRSEAALGIQIIRNLEKEASSGQFDRFRVSVTAAEALHILNIMRDDLSKLEEQFDCNIEILIEPHLNEGDFRIEKLRRKRQDKEKGENNRNRNNKRQKRSEEVEEEVEILEESAEEENQEEEQPAKEEKKPRRSRGGRRKKKADETVEKPEEAEEPAESKESEETSEAPKEKPKRRGRPKKSEKKADEEASDDGEASQSAKPKRTGWWQKIVE